MANLLNLAMGRVLVGCTCCLSIIYSIFGAIYGLCPVGINTRTYYHVQEAKSICYWATDKGQTANKSEEWCRSLNGTLAYIPDMGALLMVQQLRADLMATGEFFIGYEEYFGVLYIRGTNIEQQFTNWYSDQPDNESEHCVVIYNSNYVWYDDLCDGKYMSVCSDYSPAQIQSPSTQPQTTTTVTTSTAVTTSPTVTTSTPIMTEILTQSVNPQESFCPVDSTLDSNCKAENMFCFCISCDKLMNLTTEEKNNLLNAFKEYVKDTLLLDRSKLSATKRKKHSAEDSRTSSKAMGSSAIIIIVFVLSAIILADVPKLLQFLKMMHNNFHKTKIHTLNEYRKNDIFTCRHEYT